MDIIMQSYAEKLERAAISSERQALAGDFDRSIATLVQDTNGVRQQLASQAEAADVAAKGMIRKTRALAAASEKTTVAMLDAATTAAGHGRSSGVVGRSVLARVKLG